jgi:hypothetical protein
LICNESAAIKGAEAAVSVPISRPVPDSADAQRQQAARIQDKGGRLLDDVAALKLEVGNDGEGKGEADGAQLRGQRLLAGRGLRHLENIVPYLLL